MCASCRWVGWRRAHDLNTEVDVLLVGCVGDEGGLIGADGDLAGCAELVQGGLLGQQTQVLCDVLRTRHDG